MKKLLYVSPLPPQKSGISDYSVRLVEKLKDFFDITIWTDKYEIKCDLIKSITILQGRGVVDFGRYDYIVYNIGNNAEFHSYIYEASMEHPGIVILHDYSLFHFINEHFYEEGNIYSYLYEKLGLDRFIEYKNCRYQVDKLLHFASNNPLNEELLASKNRIVVHSFYAQRKIIDFGKSKDLVCKINMIPQVEHYHLISREDLYCKYEIPLDALVFASFGIINPHKLNEEVCQAIQSINESNTRKIYYLMIGEGTCCDKYLSEYIKKTGRVDIDEFNSFLNYVDVVINLRHPTMGETSASLVRALELGKCCIINDEGWFSEIPDHCVKKIDVDDVFFSLKNTILDLANDEELREKYSGLARRYFEEEYDEDEITKQFVDFIMKK